MPTRPPYADSYAALKPALRNWRNSLLLTGVVFGVLMMTMMVLQLHTMLKILRLLGG